jgi:P pilus assembly chaperone PapD
MIPNGNSTLRLMQRLRMGVVLATGLILFLAVDLSAGVLVAPTVVILSDKDRTGRINVENPSNKSKEIEISLGFGLPVSDSLGKVSIALQDSNVTDPRSAMTWISAFPRKFRLEPNGSQVVRLVARPPKDLPDGEFWAQIVVKSQEGDITFPLDSTEGAITTKLNMIMKTVIALKYRTGDLTAQLELTSMNVQQNDSQVVVLCNLSNRGNVSYLGVLTCRLLDADNQEISLHKSNLAVYRELCRGITFPIKEGNFRKPYQVDLRITGKGRTDVPREDMIYGNEITYSAAVQ